MLNSTTETISLKKNEIEITKDNKSKPIRIEANNSNSFQAGCSQSTFYLSEDGELNRHSLCLPEDSEAISCVGSLDEFLTRAVAETQNIEKNFETPKKKMINKARESMKFYFIKIAL